MAAPSASAVQSPPVDHSNRSGLAVLDREPRSSPPPDAVASPRPQGRVAASGVPILAGIAGGLAVSVTDPAWAVVAALILTVVAPGALVAILLVPSDDADWAEWSLLATGLGVAVLVLGGLLLALLSLPLSPGLVFGWFGGIALALSALVWRRRAGWRLARAPERATVVDCALVVGLGAALRLPSLGYSELQGDEAEVVLRATGVVQGLRDALFYHGKGPAEVVVTAVQYGLVGELSEASARLPFALAGLAGLAASYLLARRLLGRPGALAVALLLAFNGYFVAFARIAQYQGVVFFLSLLAVWCAARWALAPPPHQARVQTNVWPIFAGLFAGVGALAHYDAVFVLLPIGLLALRRGGVRELLAPSTHRAWLAGAAVGLATLLVFFGPYLASPLAPLATDRIADRVGVGVRNNLPTIWASASLYTSTIYLGLLGLLALAGAVLASGRLLRRQPAPPLWVWVLGLVWCAAPILFYAFVARKPGTHIHVASSGLALLGGWAVAALWARSRARAWRGALTGIFGLGLLAVGAYLVPIYLQNRPELVRGNLRQFALGWAAGDEVPRKERFGFPYAAGWKAVGALYAEGRLDGSFDSNENPQITHWYTRDAWRCTADPRYYLIAEGVQDEIEPPRRRIAAEYPAVGIVTVGGQPKLRIHEREAPPNSQPTVWAAEELDDRFDRALSRPALDPGVWAHGPVPPSGRYSATPAGFGDRIELLGYRLYAEEPRPDGTVRVDLYWRPLVTADGGYDIDVRLGADRVVGDGNGPGCDKSRAAQEWTAGQPFVQRASVSVAAAPPGRHPLLVGVAGTSGALPVRTALPTRDGLVEVGTVEIAP